MVDERFMRRALGLARRAALRGEVPVGALVVRDGIVLGAASDQHEKRRDATAHAELIALRRACAAAGAWRLSGATIYVTLEPCAMCAGAMVLARVARLVYGARDPKAGASGSVFDVTSEPRLNHRINVVPSMLEAECGLVLTEFFRARRRSHRE